MKEIKHKFSLDRPTPYEIKVPGHFDESWLEWIEEILITVNSMDDGSPITTLTCTVDQAALHGLLRRLYSLGLPLISVNSIVPDNK